VRPSREQVLGTLVACAALLLAALLTGERVTREMPDFEVYWTAAARAAAAEPLYRAEDGHYQFKYLPAFAILAAPLAVLPLPTAKAAWFAFSAALLAVLVSLALALLPDGRKPAWLLVALTVVVMAKFYGHELVLGQVNVLFAAIVTAALLGLRAGREALAGVLIAAAIVIKPYAVLFLPWLLARGRRASIAAAAAGMGAVLVLPALLYGAGGSVEQHAGWWRTVTDSTAPNLTNNDNVSIAAFFAKWLGAGMPAAALTAAASLALLGLAVVVFRHRGNVPCPEGLEGAMLLTCIPLLSPQGWDYVFLVSTPAVLFLLNYDDRLPRGLRLAVYVALALIGLTLFDVMGRAAYTRFMQWSVITVCYGVVVSALAVLRLRAAA
jgi:alpha-1,2-mannosyltransferase